MSDLISREALLKAIGRTVRLDDMQSVKAFITISEIIMAQPTAYNKEKVVAELEEHKAQYGKLQLAHNDANMVCVYVGKEQAVDCAIEVVRKGGVE